MKNLRNLGSQFSISYAAVGLGIIGRECPVSEC